MSGPLSFLQSLGSKFKHFWYLAISVALALSACQTTEPGKPTGKVQKILDTQKRMVRNSLNHGNPETALKNLRALMRKYPKDPSLESLMGLTQLALKNGSRAIQHFRRAYELEPVAANALNLSSAYLETGEYKKSVDLLKELHSSPRGDSYQYKERIFHNLGYSHSLMGQSAKARRWFRKALEENPTFYPSHLELARTFRQQGHPAKALRRYRQASDYCEQCLEPVRAIVQIHLKRGSPVIAKKVLADYLKQEELRKQDRHKAKRLLRFAARAAGRQKSRKGRTAKAPGQ